MNKIHIVAGALAFFFLSVAIAKSMIQAARKRKAKRESIERSQAGDSISLHDPYPGDEPIAAPADEANAAAPAEKAPEVSRSAPAAKPPAFVPPQPEQDQHREQIYKWN